MTDIPRMAISIRQPWAWAILYAGKDIENRSVAAIRQGMNRPGLRVAVHAAKTMTQAEYRHARLFMQKIGIECPRPDAMPRGAIVGSVLFGEVVEDSSSHWWIGPAGICLSQPEFYPAPVLCSGRLGLFDWREVRETDIGKNPGGKPHKWMKEWQPTPWYEAV